MDNTEQYLSFIINNRFFAFEAKDVLEVLINRPISPMPKAEKYIAGVINFRGEVVTVVDTSVKFGIADEIINTRIIIVICTTIDHKQYKLACLCDNVIQMESISLSQIEQVPSFGTYYDPSLLKSVFYIKDDLYSVLDVEKIFTAKNVLELV